MLDKLLLSEFWCVFPLVLKAECELQLMLDLLLNSPFWTSLLPCCYQSAHLKQNSSCATFTLFNKKPTSVLYSYNNTTMIHQAFYPLLHPQTLRHYQSGIFQKILFVCSLLVRVCREGGTGISLLSHTNVTDGGIQGRGSGPGSGFIPIFPHHIFQNYTTKVSDCPTWHFGASSWRFLHSQTIASGPRQLMFNCWQCTCTQAAPWLGEKKPKQLKDPVICMAILTPISRPLGL